MGDLKNLALDLFKAFENNFAFYAVLVTVLGGLNQGVALLMMDPQLIIFYSVQQGIVEGVITLLFLAVSTLFLYIISILTRYITASNNKTFKYISLLALIVFYLL